MSGQPILVAGKTGQLARCLVQEASWRGTALVAMGRPELDLTQPDALARAVEAHVPRAIVNAAAYTAVDKAEAEPALAMAVNRDGAGALAAAAARLGVPFIHVSTDYVFDGRKHGAYVEEDAPAPLGAYGQYLRSLTESGDAGEFIGRVARPLHSGVSRRLAATPQGTAG